ncbi:MAG: PrgI family protein [Eubacteriales bacterium]|nr:PrgI family protein [Eubacteriales bacterium]
MAYVTVPKDLSRVKSKVVFGLTKRQLICFGGALLIGVPLFFFLRGRIPNSAAALIMVFAMLPGFLLALYERHGQPLEVVIWQIVQCCFVRPKERPYQTSNAYSALVRQRQMEKEVNAIVQKAKERSARKNAGKAHPRRKERNPGHHPQV